MEIVLLLIAVAVMIWVVRAGILAKNAALSGQKLTTELKQGKVDVVKLFEQKLPEAAKAKFSELKQSADAYCAKKNILPNEVPKFLPAILELQEAFYTAEAAYAAMIITSAPKPTVIAQIPYTQPQSHKDIPQPSTQLQSEQISITWPELPAIDVSKPQIHRGVKMRMGVFEPGTGIPDYSEAAFWVTAYKDVKGFGFIKLYCDMYRVLASMVYVDTQETIIQDRYEKLTSFLDKVGEWRAETHEYAVPGNFVIHEFSESEVPPQYAKRVWPSWIEQSIAKSFESQLPINTKGWLGHDRPDLQRDNERILEFADYQLHPTEEFEEQYTSTFMEDNEIYYTEFAKDCVVPRLKAIELLALPRVKIDQLFEVYIIPNQETKKIITPMLSALEYGFIHVGRKIIQNDNEMTTYAVIRGLIDELEEFLNLYAINGILPGAISSRIFLESDIPTRFKMQIDNSAPFKEAIEPYLLRAKGVGPVLTRSTKSGTNERIVRFSEYVMNTHDSEFDYIQHDNYEEVTSWIDSQ